MIMDYAEKKKDKKISIRTIVYVGMFAALMGVISQCAIPMPSGVPATLQIFGVTLIGAVIGWKMGLGSIAVYLLLGAVGVPVFANFHGGAQVLVGSTGGFLWGYLPMVALCGTKLNQKNVFLGILASLAGMMVSYVLGALQFGFLNQMDFVASFLLVGAPYLLKDVILSVIAFVLGDQIRRRLNKAGLL